MANWSNPTLTSLYTDFLNDLKARDTDLALQFDGVTATNLTTGTIRWSSSANRWQKWNGTSWAELTTLYALTGLSTTGNASIGGTLAVTGATTLAAATATTPATNDNSTAVATTAYVRAQAYAPLASPALTGTPTAPTAAADTNTTQLATTAYVLGQASSTTPAMNGTGAVGTASRWARADHVHPTDTSRAPLASPTFTGTPAAPTAAVGTNTTQLATCAYVNAEIANDAPLKNGTGATGTWGISITGNAGTATALQLAPTINGVSFSGSASITITANTPQALTAGSFLTSTGTFDGSTARTFAVDATSANTASKVVARDASGNFSAGTITANLTGTASGNLALTGGTLSGALQTIAGTAAAPGIGIGEANTGLFRPSAGVLALSTGGSEVLRLTAANGIGLGSTGTNVNVGFRHAKSITGGTTAWAQLVDGAVQTDVTSVAAGIASAIGTAASTTLASLVHFQASTGTLGAGTTITNQIGFSATSTMDGATNDFGFYGNIGAGTGNWNCYMVGAAPNFFSGQVQLGAGSVGTPSLSTNGDTNTGIYFPAADTIGFVDGGVEAMRLDSNGRLIIGATQGRATPSSLSAFARLQLEGGDNNDSAFSITNTTNGPASRAANIRTARIRGTGIVADGDATGQWSFWGYDGSDFRQNALIEARVVGTPGLTNMPGRLLFGTAPAGTNGVVATRLLIEPTGDVNVVGAGTAGTTQAVSFNGSAPTNSLVVDASGRLLLGTSSQRAIEPFGNTTSGTNLSHVVEQIHNTGVTGLACVNNSDTTAASGSFIYLARTRGSAVNTNVVVQNGDNLGTIAFAGADGTDIRTKAAAIYAEVDGAPGANDMPGRIVFATTADGAAAPTERLRITSTGQVRLAGAGITFNGATATANELDDYEEGTFTPTITGGTTAGTATYVTRVGRYTKIGNRVFFQVFLDYSAFNGTGEVRVSLPSAYISNTTASNFQTVSIRPSNYTLTASNVMTGVISPNTAYVRLEQSPVGGGAVSNAPVDAAATLVISGVYEA